VIRFVSKSLCQTTWGRERGVAKVNSPENWVHKADVRRTCSLMLPRARERAAKWPSSLQTPFG
jgi:hypothetical protein